MKKSIVVTALVAFGSICSVACTADPVVTNEPDPKTVPILVKQPDSANEGAGNLAPRDWRCWRIWWGCAVDTQVLTDCDPPNSTLENGNYCNSCGYTCTNAE